MDYEKIFAQIKELARTYQDVRDDEGHAEVVTNYAIKLNQIISGNPLIIVPAARLHDIGWSQVPKNIRDRLVANDLTREENYKIRELHQIEGVKLAEKLLKQTDYPEEYTKEVLEIISQHDTREGFYSNEDSIVGDADKLWRVSYIGVTSDLRKRRKEGMTSEKWAKHLEKRVTEMFYYDVSREIAKQELDLRKKELEIEC